MANVAAVASTSSSRTEGVAGRAETGTEASSITFTEFVQYQRCVSTPEI